MTNYEKIRSMTPEELAKILPCPHEVKDMPCLGDDELPGNETYHKCILEWLKREEKRKGS